MQRYAWEHVEGSPVGRQSACRDRRGHQKRQRPEVVQNCQLLFNKYKWHRTEFFPKTSHHHNPIRPTAPRDAKHTTGPCETLPPIVWKPAQAILVHGNLRWRAKRDWLRLQTTIGDEDDDANDDDDGTG